MVSVSEEKDGLFPGEEFRSSFWARMWCKSVVSDNGSMLTGEKDVKIMDEKREMDGEEEKKSARQRREGEIRHFLSGCVRP